jgi:hypothetical protein
MALPACKTVEPQPEHVLIMNINAYDREEIYHAVLEGLGVERIPVFKNDWSARNFVETNWVRLDTTIDPFRSKNDPSMERRDILLGRGQIKYFIAILETGYSIRAVIKSGETMRQAYDLVYGNYTELEVRMNSPEWAKVKNLSQTINLMLKHL